MVVIADALRKHNATTIVHGAARGADRLSVLAALSLGIKDIRAYPAQWDIHGKSAGHKRNQKMLDVEHLPADPFDVVLAFPLPDSIGTWDMVNRAKKAGIPVEVIQP